METFEKITKFLTSLGINFEVQQLNDEIQITLQKDDKRKKEFEALVQKMNDDMFLEVLKEADIKNLSELYKEDEEQVFTKFGNTAIQKLTSEANKLLSLSKEFSKFLKND